MKFGDLLAAVQREPVFETGLLLVGGENPGHVRSQLSRWVRAGKLLELRRGLYALAPPFRKVEPHPFLVANRLVRGSYVSTQSALWHAGLIPEHVPATTSVCTGRPATFDTPLGRFQFRHVRRALFSGYRLVEVGDGQQAALALPEKALLDLLHLVPRAEAPEYLAGLRLQNLDRLDLAALDRLAEASGSPKLRRAARRLGDLARAEQRDYEALS